MLAKEIATALKQGKRSFISGMARGSDIFAAELVLEYRAQYRCYSVAQGCSGLHWRAGCFCSG